MYMFKKNAFTLVEIIIVIVIIGILATLTLPRLSNEIKKAQASEAIEILSRYVKAIDRCYQITEVFTLCDADTLVRDFTYGSGMFVYSFSSAAPVVSVKVVRNGVNADSFTFSINTLTGLVTKTVSTSGVFSGMQLNK